jgi:hypothetical protein
MGKAWIIAVVLLLAACATRHGDYTLPPPPANPLAFVERFVMEQPEKQRPQSVHATAEYLEYGDATWYKKGEWAGRDSAKQKVVRIYYASIGENYLYSKRRWWIVRTRNKQGSLLADIWTDDKEAALEYMAALEELRKDAAGK